MTWFSHDAGTLGTGLHWLAWGVFGAGLGMWHFGTLRLNTRWWLGQEAQPARPLAALGLQLLRLGLTGLGLLLAVRQGGAGGLVAAAVGLGLARTGVLHRVKRQLEAQGHKPEPAPGQNVEQKPELLL